ncbi:MULTISPECIES: SusF/SusE family outer membrane protein [Chitinophagaceae]
MKVIYKSSHRSPLPLVALFALMCGCLLILQACKKDTKAPMLFPLQTGDLSASKDTVVINSATPGDEAVTVSWSAFPNAMITYTLVLSFGDNKDSVEVPSGATSRKFNHGELNNILVDKLGMTIGTKSELDFTLFAKISTKNDSAVSKTIKIWVTPALTGATYAQLWVVGDATPAGWNIDNPSPMTKDPTNSFQFKYNEVLNAGEFKIPTSTGNWGTDFFMPLVNHPPLSSTEVKLTIGGNPDYKWQITNPGPYKILLNISSSPFIKIVPFTPYTKLWMIGDATPAGWNIETPTPMVATAGNPYEFSYTGPLSVGEFKIPVSTGNWDTDYFMPAANDEGVGSTNAIFVPGGSPDNKWKISDAGNYKVVINQLYETISITKQ